MRLELGTLEVRQVEFAARTDFSNGLLTIHKDELIALLTEDDAVESVDVELAKPGDSTRIVHVLDAVEPLVKVKGTSSCFPGMFAPARTCGEGRTHRLKGVAVIGCAEFPQPVSGVQRFVEGFVDMSGTVAPRCVCSDTCNIVLLPKAADGISNEEWDVAVRSAGMKAANYLARTTLDLEPDRVEVFELGSVDSSLPRVVYINQVQEQGFGVHTLLYGKPVENLLPTVLHPNEMLDGAVVSGNYKGGMRVATCVHTNNPILKSLYQHHGRDLNFLGIVISRGHHDDHQQKECSAQYAAKVARLLGADSATISLEGTGNSHIDFMLTVKACEEMGIKTAAVLHEFGGPEGNDVPVIDSVPEADAIVTVGTIDQRVIMPRVERVIGGSTARRASGESVDPYGPFEVTPLNLLSGYWQMGIAGFTAKDF